MTAIKMASERLASLVRLRTVGTSHFAGVPHLGSCLSCTDILVVLYNEILNITADIASDSDRDRFVLSKGHAAPVLYQILSLLDFFNDLSLLDYHADGSFFGEHPSAPGVIPGIEAATGSLGHGFPISVGMALASKIQNKKNMTFALLGDGECNEGSVWEAAMVAARHSLDNLIAIVDFNKWQATGRSTDVMALDSLAAKWRSFGWDVCEIDGHNFGEIRSAFATTHVGRPLVLVAHTVKGKGISFMEDDNNWHYRCPTQLELVNAATELGFTDVSLKDFQDLLEVR